eukprot:scaffold28593_cov62-Phaeocystis_antarctica.AAC.7
MRLESERGRSETVVVARGDVPHVRANFDVRARVRRADLCRGVFTVFYVSCSLVKYQLHLLLVALCGLATNRTKQANLIDPLGEDLLLGLLDGLLDVVGRHLDVGLQVLGVLPREE